MSALRRSSGPASELLGDEDLFPTGRPSPRPVRVVAARDKLWYRLGDVWRNRELLDSLIRKELKVKYKNSALGFLWSMLNPALTLVVYYFVFQVVLRNGIPLFPIYLLCGLLNWNLFSAALPSGTTSITSNAAIVRQVSFPREVLALAPVGAGLFFFFLQAIVLAMAMAVFRIVPALAYLPLLIPAVLALTILSAALSVFLSAVNVQMRDMEHLLQLVLMAWFWATPIVYAYQLIAEKLVTHHIPTWILFLNPVTPIVLTFQRALYAQTTPAGTNGGAPVQILPPHAGPMWYLEPLLIVIAISLVLYVAALAMFIRVEGNFAEEL